MPTPALPLEPSDAPTLALSAVEVRERLELRDGLRLRRSVDHLARAWYGSIGSLLLTGVAVKLLHDRPGLGWGLAVAASLGLLGWTFSLFYLLRCRRVAREERGMLERLQALETRAPKPPELF